MRHPEFDVQKVIDHLQGTCMNTVASALSELYDDIMFEEDLTDEDLAAIDNELFNCTACGWWCETSEQSLNTSEQMCLDCVDEEEDEED